MSRFMFKPQPANDFYVIWDDTVEAPTEWGTKEQLLKQVRFQEVDREFSDADEFGSADFGHHLGWEAKKIAVSTMGEDGTRFTVTRENFEQFCSSIQSLTEFDSSLTEPYEDPDESWDVAYNNSF